MKRLFPAPWLSLALWVLWLVLNLSISAGNLLLGAILGFCAPLMMRKLRPLPIRIRRPGVILRLFFQVGRDVLASNLAVAWGVLNAGRRPPHSTFIKVPLDRSILLLHVFDLDDEAHFIQHFKATYERPLMEIFE